MVAAPLLLPKEVRHVSACVAGHDACPLCCWVQAVSTHLCVVMSHKGDSVIVVQCSETENVEQLPFRYQVRSGGGRGLAHNHPCCLRRLQDGLDTSHWTLACIVCFCGLDIIDAGVEEDGVIGVGCLYRLQAAVDDVDGCRFLLRKVQPVGTAQSGGVDSIHDGIVENEKAGEVVPVVVPACVGFVVDVEAHAAVLTGGAGGVAAVRVVLADCQGSFRK